MSVLARSTVILTAAIVAVIAYRLVGPVLPWWTALIGIPLLLAGAFWIKGVEWQQSDDDS